MFQELDAIYARYQQAENIPGLVYGVIQGGALAHAKGLGVASLETKAPVVPVAVIGTNVIAPPGKAFGKVVRPIIRYGKPLDFSRYDGMENDRYILRAIADEIMYEILRLSDQEYVDLYATDAKKRADGKPRKGDKPAA